jgi:carboxypeptidase Taq
MTAYHSLEARFRRVGALQEAASVLRWDGSAMMPPGGAGARAEQVATLRGLIHEQLTAPDIAELLAAAESEAVGFGPWQRANLREMRRRWRHAAAVPGDLVQALSRASSACEAVWRVARPGNDFAAVRPALGEVLRRVREVASAKAVGLGLSPYEALLDSYEPGRDDRSAVRRDRRVFARSSR